jgi:T5SS/PEP-CTERM-associated repeat protein
MATDYENEAVTAATLAPVYTIPNYDTPSYNTLKTVDGYTSRDMGNTYVGDGSEGIYLCIEQGFTLNSANAYVGYWDYTNSNWALMDTTYPSGDDHALLTGTGAGDTSTNWTISGDLYIGYFAKSNSLAISSGASVSNGTGYIGRGDCLDQAYGYYSVNYNSATLTGLGATDTTTTWTNTGMLYVGYSWADHNSLLVQSGADVTSNGGTVGRGYYRDEDQQVTIANATYNTATVTGAGSTWNCGTGDLSIGEYGNNNTLTISIGGSVNAGNVSIGVQYTDYDNLVELTGLGTTDAETTLTATGKLYVGRDGYSNQMTVKSGADVTSVGGVIGDGTAAGSTLGRNNSVTVDGAGSTWDCGTGDLAIGNYGHTNALTISSGGLVSDVNGTIGYFSNSTGNAVTVTGTGSQWLNSGLLTVGLGGSGTLTIESGGLVTAASLSIGTGGGLYIKNGCLALDGDAVSDIETLLGNGKEIYVWNAGAYVTLTTGNYADYVTYYSNIDSGNSTLASAYDLSGTFTVVTAVPEPAAVALFGGLSTLAMALAIRRRPFSRTLKKDNRPG